MGKNWDTDLDNMVFIIRNEGILPLKELCNKYGTQKVLDAQSNFVSRLKELMHNTFGIKIVVIDALEQIEKTKKDLNGKQTISLDTFYSGTYNLEVTRLFEIVNQETKFIRMINRPSTPTLEEQLGSIAPGEYTIVDDDAVGGRTVKEIISRLPAGVNVVSKYLMMDNYRNEREEPILDVVDCRDFIVGLQGSGLTTLIKGVGIVRLPYLYPFVDIGDKANIPDGMECAVSKEIWNMNKLFWAELNSDETVNNLGEDFIAISKYLGLGTTNKVQDIFNQMMNICEHGVIL